MPQRNMKRNLARQAKKKKATCLEKFSKGIISSKRKVGDLN